MSFFDELYYNWFAASKIHRFLLCFFCLAIDHLRIILNTWSQRSSCISKTFSWKRLSLCLPKNMQAVRILKTGRTKSLWNTKSTKEVVERVKPAQSFSPHTQTNMTNNVKNKEAQGRTLSLQSGVVITKFDYLPTVCCKRGCSSQGCRLDIH